MKINNIVEITITNTPNTTYTADIMLRNGKIVTIPAPEGEEWKSERLILCNFLRDFDIKHKEGFLQFKKIDIDEIESFSNICKWTYTAPEKPQVH